MMQFKRRLHVAFVVLGAGALAIAMHKRVDGSGDRSAALARALKARGLITTADDVRWVDEPSGLKSAVGCGVRAVVRAAPAKGEPNDVYLAFAKVSPEGVLLDVCDAFDLTETSSADESRPIVVGERIAYVAHPLIAEGKPTVHVIELGGQPK